jgi:AcrR family transcriptional regulator
MTTLTQSRRNDPTIRRGVILEEATRALSEKGFFGFRIQDVAQRCGLTNGGLLYHFASKEELMLAVLEERELREKAAIRNATGITSLQRDGLPLALQHVRSVLRAIVARGAEQAELVRLLHVLGAEALHTDHPAHAYFVEREKRVLGIFAEMLRPYATNPESTARQILASATGLEIQWLRSGCSFDLAEEWESALAELFAQIEKSSRKESQG